MKIRVKFCGITSEEDARKAVIAGADSIGFIFYKKSPRYMAVNLVENIVKGLPPFVSSTGVFVNEDIGFIEECVERCGLNTVQLHGDEDVGYCLNFKNFKFKGIKLIKAIRVKNRDSLLSIEECPVDAVLLDAYNDVSYGGTGKSFDMSLALLAKEYGKAIILSGGLNPDTVYDAIKNVRPYGVDVSSGIESSPGIKNMELMEEFIEEVRRAERR